MSYCDKCGAYISVDETACPACGYDPAEEERKAREAEEKARAAEAAEKAREEQKRAREQARREAERRRAEREQSWQQDPRQSQSYAGGGAAQSQYTSQRTGQSGPGQGQQTSQRTGEQWAPPWQSAQERSGAYDEAMRRQAADSADNRRLSILSYIPFVPTFLIPLLTRKDDPFAKYHANQGFALFLTTAAISVLSSASGIFSLGGLFGLYCMVRGISNVQKGKMEPLPFIGNWKLIK